MQTQNADGVMIAILEKDYSAFDQQQLDETQKKLFTLMDQSDPPKLLLDMSHTEFFTSTFIEVLFRVWNRVNRRHGQFAIAALTPNCLEIVETARLDTLWKIYSSAQEAVAAMNSAES